ncbi:MAG TPA: hypothetical protein VFQ53_00330 [Kofleriaceae bacterium]|nr:hypothetical protein [Kofleriaceae bacterium]
MGFEFAETMSGTIEWDDKPGTKHPFRFEVSAHAGSIRRHLLDGKAILQGTIYAPPIAEGAPAEGVITIRPVGQRIIRYELAFAGDDGKHYELVGQKAIRWTSPLRTFTELPAEILDEEHRRVATCQARFDLKRDGLTFLRSFRHVAAGDRRS